MKDVVGFVVWDALLSQRRDQLLRMIDDSVEEAEKAIWSARVAELELIARMVAGMIPI
jgi:hypothetical protein